VYVGVGATWGIINFNMANDQVVWTWSFMDPVVFFFTDLEEEKLELTLETIHLEVIGIVLLGYLKKK
jgi:hypothetical protein